MSKKINLVNGGIFPITKDIDGNLIEGLPDTGINVSGTIQGEGKLTGVTCLFIRTSACNLRCAWYNKNTGVANVCDTPYSSHAPEKNRMEISDIIKIVKQNTQGIKHIVISGGEPTMQTEELASLLFELKKEGYHTTIETNATIFDSGIAIGTDLISMSPKLANSTPYKQNLEGTGFKHSESWERKHERDRKNIEVIQKYIDACYQYDWATGELGESVPNGINYNDRLSYKDFQLKFVVTSPEDVEEIKNDYLSKLKGVRPEDVLLMPEGISTEQLNEKNNWIIKSCLVNGYRFCPRLHITLFGKARSV